MKREMPKWQTESIEMGDVHLSFIVEEWGLQKAEL